MTEIRYSMIEARFDGDYGEVRYWRSEPRQGLPVVLVHGYGALIEHWKKVLRPIAREHTVYALDLYNFGYSAIANAPASKEIWADQIADLVGKIVGEPAVVVGHSMGGIAATQFAHDYPDFVRGLVLVNSTGMAEENTTPSGLDQTFMNLVRTAGIGEVLAGLVANEWGVRQSLSNAYYRKEHVTPELVATFLGPLRRPGGPQAYLAVTRGFERFYITVEKGAIQAPALLIWGNEDRSVPPSLAGVFKERLLPQADVHVIAASGHCPFDETPEAFCDALLPWLGAVAARPAPPPQG